MSKVYLISPREPCGATWLINCLLTLGVKTYRSTIGEDMWLGERGTWTLNPEENILKKWLPILSEKSRFKFREDIEVEWAHIWPTTRVGGAKIIYFVRDPRDALFSRYKREAPQASFREFLDFPDVHTLMDKIDTWVLFNDAWLAQPRVQVFKFEEYKLDAFRTLSRAANALGIEASDSDLMDAVARSSFERAAAAEKSYRKLHPEDSQIINRASQVGSWKDPSLESEASDIESRCGALMARFGYLPAQPGGFEVLSYRPHSEMLRFYRSLAVPAGFWDRAVDGRERARTIATVATACDMDIDLLNRFRLEAYERLLLRNGLGEFLRGIASDLNRKFGVRRIGIGSLRDYIWRAHGYLSVRGIHVPVPFRRFVRKLMRLCGIYSVSRSR